MASIPKKADPRSNRITKKTRPTTAYGVQAQALETLFAKQPEIRLASSSTKGPKTTADLAPPPEIVANVQGSSAGAGSGEFHVYKAARRKEYERLRLMDEEAKREEQDKAWAEKHESLLEKDNAKTSKNRKRREKAKLNKGKRKGMAFESDKDLLAPGAVKIKASSAPLRRRDDDGTDGDRVEEEQGLVLVDDF